MLLNSDQLEKKLDKEEFQETRSIDAFRALMTQFQTFINFRYYFDDFDGTMICKYFQAHTRIEIRQSCDTLIQHMESVKKSIDERALHKRKYDIRVNKRLMQSKDRKVDSSKALHVGLIVSESNETESKRHVSSNRSRNDTHTDDADINSVNDKQPMDENGQHGQILNETSNKANIIREINVLETRNIDLESSVARLLGENEKLNKENEHLKQTYKDLFDSIKKISVHTKDHADYLIVQLNNNSVENANLKAQIQEKVFANVALKNELRKLKGNSVDTKFAKPSILGKLVLQPPRNQSVVRQPNALKSKRPNFLKWWKPTSRIFKTAGLRWIPTGKMFPNSKTMVDNKPLNGLNEDITNPYKCEQTLNVSVDALTQARWIEAMQEELNEFEHLKVWELIPHPDKVMVITLKWIYKVKLDELGGILKNKTRLVARAYRQEEGIYFEESFALVARLDAI
uniref:Retrovirus-related Pol polyprotein from transposon TNT 1-94 n=1 Tax=Tanacetum cinerariifolium TaxID=118510 RepID=A0A6L2J598_TANCI|nr:retrovirus-related Pol polyprotein from transposon TNT 1-94 [Tanacetum cinerariifolium]